MCAGVSSVHDHVEARDQQVGALPAISPLSEGLNMWPWFPETH